jgi:hypothetical protein
MTLPKTRRFEGKTQKKKSRSAGSKRPRKPAIARAISDDLKTFDVLRRQADGSWKFAVLIGN